MEYVFRDPDVPLTEVEIATTSLFLDLDKIREELASDTVFFPSSTLSKAIIPAFRHGVLYWLDHTSKLNLDLSEESAVPLALSCHTAFKNIKVSVYADKLSHDKQWKVWSNRSFAGAQFSCGLCWTTLSIHQGVHHRPTNACLLWGIPSYPPEWPLDTDYHEKFSYIFPDFNPDYTAGGWWQDPIMVAHGHGDPHALVKRFQDITGLRPDMNMSAVEQIARDFGVEP